VILRDGRELALAEDGDPDGPVVMYVHGAPTSRLDISVHYDIVASQGTRVIAVDRPWFGGSTLPPGRTLDGWVGDVVALADALSLTAFAVMGLTAFAVMGLSAGGPHMVAARLPNRVTGLGLVASPTDPSWSGSADRHSSEENELLATGDGRCRTIERRAV
jgi:pimeloyl-ACP methyl ester carboxylesterase